MLFGSSGIRRLWDEDLLKLAMQVGSTVAASYPHIVLGRDARTTGNLLAHAFSSGALAAGGNISDGGIIPTPTVAYNARHHDAGCCTTASHNPESYNGLKMIQPDGSAFTPTQQDAIEETYLTAKPRGWEQQGTSITSDLITPHLEAILDSVNACEGLNVVLDCGNGAASSITPRLLHDLGTTARCMNATPSGFFARPSEPTEENLKVALAMTRATGAQAGLFHDGDADRFMAADNKGRFIHGDHLLILFAEYLGAKKIVTTVDASMAIEEVAEVRRTPVGDSFVSTALTSWGDFGGEPSGSWIFPKHSLCPDGIYAAGLFCEITKEIDTAAAIDAIPSYPMIRSSEYSDTAREMLTRLGAENPTDGLRIEEEEGWCLIRASGTEPKIRITAEGRDRAAAKKMHGKGCTLIRSAKKDQVKEH